MRTILLIRHGESHSNAGLPTSSAHDVALTELGNEQAKCIAKYLKSQFLLDLIVTSSYPRAKQTALPTILSFPFVPEREWSVQEFTFLSLSLNRSSTVDERRPFVERYWNACDPSHVDGPGAESFEQFVERVRHVMMYLKCVKKYETVAIFSHLQFICALLWLSQRGSVNLSPETMQEFRRFLNMNWLVNGAIVHFDNSDKKWQYKIITSYLSIQEKEDLRGKERLERWNV